MRFNFVFLLLPLILMSCRSGEVKQNTDDFLNSYQKLLEGPKTPIEKKEIKKIKKTEPKESPPTQKNYQREREREDGFTERWVALF